MIRNVLKLRTVRAANAVAITLALSGSAWADGPKGTTETKAGEESKSDKETTSAQQPTEPGKPDVSKLPNGGFALDFEIWRPAGHGPPKRLVITYTWGGLTRTVEASRQNDRWHAEFPAQPAAHEQATLILRYSFELSQGDWDKVRDAEYDVLSGILLAIKKASSRDAAARGQAKEDNEKAAENKKAADAKVAEAQAAEKKAEADFKAKQNELNEANTAVANATAANREEALKQQKAKQEALVAASAEWQKQKQQLATAEGAQGLAAAALESPNVAPAKFSESFALESKTLAASKSAETLRQYGSETQDGMALLLDHLGIEETPSGWEIVPSERDRLAKAASDWIKNSTGSVDDEIPETATLYADAPNDTGCSVPKDAVPTALTVAQAQAMLEQCATFLKTKTKDKAQQDRLAALPSYAGDVRAAELDKVEKIAELRDTRSFKGARLAERSLYRAEKLEQGKKDLKPLVQGLDTAFAIGGRKEDGATLIKGAAKPRRYDIATGALYVHDLEDVIIPSLITICGWEGCLDPTEVAWDAEHGWRRSFSIDAGIRAKTIGTQDRRQSDTLSFFFGMSWNPVSILRLSAGGYAFENAQKTKAGEQPWQLTWYAGATVNLLNATSILGAIGLSNDLSPTASGVNLK